MARPLALFCWASFPCRLVHLDPNFHLWLGWQMCGVAGCALNRQKTEPAQEAKKECYPSKIQKTNIGHSHNVSIYTSFKVILFYLNEIQPVLKFPPWRGGRLYAEVLNLFFFEAIPAGQLLGQHQQLILSPYYDLLNKPWCTDWFLRLQPLPNSSV